MKKFEVLETHLGDKLYKPGDPETGTRMAEPDEVRHLVDLGVLKPIGGDDDTAQAGGDANAKGSAEDAALIADLRAQIASLTTERDDARQDAAELANKLAALDKPVDDAGKPADEPTPTPARRGRGNQ